MRRLSPNLFDRRFDDLVELGRSRLPTLAPIWTNYNLPNPGITLVEVLAWATEAQLYALARMRRDERAAYAELLGVPTEGRRPARGQIWPDTPAPGASFAAYGQSQVIGANARVSVAKGGMPDFRATHSVLWAPGRIHSVATRTRDGRVLDRTAANADGIEGFAPFADNAAPGTRLLLGFQTHGASGLFPRERAKAKDAMLSIGVRVEGNVDLAPDAPPQPLRAWLVDADRRTELPVRSDGTRGLRISGVIMLDISGVAHSPAQFTVELEPGLRMPRAPRVLAIRLGAVPVEQVMEVTDESHPANGQVDQRAAFDVPGLCYAAGTEPVRVRVQGDAAQAGSQPCAWTRVDDLADHGPDDCVYVLDAPGQAIRFGNGINGRIPSAGQKIYLDYLVSAGEGGNLVQHHTWMVQGVEGAFGRNLDPMAGGRDATDGEVARRTARQKARDTDALVTAADFAGAALGLADLGVAHARVLPPAQDDVVRLLVMQSRAATATDAAGTPETPAWLAAVRSRLAPRMQLGSRLQVAAPRQVRYAVRIALCVGSREDPREVENRIREELRTRFANTSATLGPTMTALGAPISARDIAVRVRKLPGVARIESIALVDADGVEQAALKVPRTGLPRLDVDASKFTVRRAGANP